MATIKGLKVSDQQIEKARVSSHFIKVTNSPDKNVVVKNTISSAHWRGARVNDIYETQYRLLGTADNVRAALQELGVADGEIDQLIDDSITVDNYTTTKAADFAREIGAKSSYKQNTTPTFEDIIFCSTNLSSAEEADIFDKKKSEVDRKGKASLLDKLLALKKKDAENAKIKNREERKDYILDISKLVGESSEKASAIALKAFDPKKYDFGRGTLVYPSGLSKLGLKVSYEDADGKTVEVSFKYFPFTSNNADAFANLEPLADAEGLAFEDDNMGDALSMFDRAGYKTVVARKKVVRKAAKKTSSKKRSSSKKAPTKKRSSSKKSPRSASPKRGRVSK